MMASKPQICSAQQMIRFVTDWKTLLAVGGVMTGLKTYHVYNEPKAIEGKSDGPSQVFDTSFGAVASKYNTRLEEFVCSHSFCNQIEILLPLKEPSSKPETQFDNISSGSFLAATCPISSFVQPAILENVIQNVENDFQALSIDNSVEPNEGIAICQGHLNLKVREETYKKLGIPGAKSEFDEGFFLVQVKLTSSNFKSKGYFYKKVTEALKGQENQLSFICCTNQNTDALLKIWPIGYRPISAIVDNTHSSEVKATQIPRLERLRRTKKGEMFKQLSSVEIHYAMEEFGRLSSGFEGQNDLANSKIGNLEKHVWTGLFSPKKVLECIEEMKASLESNVCEWTAIIVRGFLNTPVSWQLKEHGRNNAGGGENDYVILLLPSQQYIIFACSGASDQFQGF